MLRDCCNQRACPTGRFVGDDDLLSPDAIAAMTRFLAQPGVVTS